MKNKLFSALLSIVIAFGLWLYVINTVSPGSKADIYNIPVVMEGESVLHEHGLMITAVSTDMVSLQLSGNRSDLSKVDKSNITVKVDLSKIYEPGYQIPLTYTITFPGNVASNAFVIESKTPSTLAVNVERRITKEVPVEVSWIGSAAEGFMSDRENRVLDYSTVSVTGPSSVVEQIAKAVIEIDLTNQRESISQSYAYTLCDESGNPVDAQLIVTNVEQIHADVRIQRVKDVALVYTLVEGGGAKTENVTVDLSVDSIRVSGSEAVLDVLGDTLSIGTINLAEIPKSTVLTFTIVLPEGVTNLTGVTEVEANVKLSGLATRDFTIEEIESVNVPEGLEAEMITEKLTLTVRGPASQVAKLTQEDISATVDFSVAEVGTSTYKAVIAFAEGFEDVGTLRVDTISVSVTAAEG